MKLVFDVLGLVLSLPASAEHRGTDHSPMPWRRSGRTGRRPASPRSTTMRRRLLFFSRNLVVRVLATETIRV
jgi:hypothetical protein